MKRQNPKLFGHAIQNFVATELLKQANNSRQRYDLTFYRTRDGGEVDFVIERHDGKYVAIEVKHAENITAKDLKGIKEFSELAGDDLITSIVLCNAPRVLEYEKNIFLVPFNTMW
jgi:predicted AAA+ superfamily ATPase